MKTQSNFHPWEGGEGKITGQYVLCRVELAKVALSEKRYAEALALLNETEVYPFNLGEGKLANAEENDIWYYKGEALRGLGYLELGNRSKASEFLDEVRDLDINHQGGQIHRNLCGA